MECKTKSPRRMSAIGVVFAVGFLVAEPLWAQDAACSKCGPGEHWIDTCNLGQDVVGDHYVIAGIDLIPGGDCPATISATLVPCPAPDNFLVVNRSGPLNASVNFPTVTGPPGHGDPDVIDTEIVSMCLTNGEVIYRAGEGTGQGPQGANLLASCGAIAEANGDVLTGVSFFDVFFEIEIVDSGTFLYNHTALRVSTNIICVPPRSTYDAFIPGGCLALFNDPDPGEGTWIADASSGAQHRLLSCGDNIITNPPETCDGTAIGTCVGACRAPNTVDQCTCCGDGILQFGSGEGCDPPGALVCPGNAACLADCTCPCPPDCPETCLPNGMCSKINPALPGWAGIALAGLLLVAGIFVFGNRRKNPAT